MIVECGYINKNEKDCFLEHNLCWHYHKHEFNEFLCTVELCVKLNVKVRCRKHSNKFEKVLRKINEEPM